MAKQAVQIRATVERIVRELLQIVVIDLAADENAQEIFETLNARGAQLTAADLIKISSSSACWSPARTWKSPIKITGRILKRASGKLKWSGSVSALLSVLNHWLVTQIVARLRPPSDWSLPMQDIRYMQQLACIGISSQLPKESGAIFGLFGYRTGVLESEVIKPQSCPPGSATTTGCLRHRLEKALNVVEAGWYARCSFARRPKATI